MQIKVQTTDVHTVENAADLIGISRATAYRWVKKGKIQTIKRAGHIVVPVSEVLRLQK
jgi:excisionase family DNA binding protein